MEIRIVIREQDWVEGDDTPPPPDGVSMRGPIPIAKYNAMDSDSAAVLGIVIQYGPGIAVGVLSSWIYDLLKKRLPDSTGNAVEKVHEHRVSIDRKQVVVEAGAIAKVIQEKIEVVDNRHERQ